MPNIRMISLVLFISFFLVDKISAQNKKILEDITSSCWQVKDYKIEQGGVALEMEQILKFSKREICFGQKPLSLIIDTLLKPKYTIRLINDKVLWKDYFINKKNLGTKSEILYDIKLKETQKRSYIVPEYFLFYDGTYLYFMEDGVNFRLEKKEKVNKYLGTGNMIKEFVLTGKEAFLNLSYEFFTDADELNVYDQNGKELFQSGMMNTSKPVNKVVNLKNVTKLVFKIESKASNSRWAFWFDAK